MLLYVLFTYIIQLLYIIAARAKPRSTPVVVRHIMNACTLTAVAAGPRGYRARIIPQYRTARSCAQGREEEDEGEGSASAGARGESRERELRTE